MTRSLRKLKALAKGHGLYFFPGEGAIGGPYFSQGDGEAINGTDDEIEGKQAEECGEPPGRIHPGNIKHQKNLRPKVTIGFDVKTHGAMLRDNCADNRGGCQGKKNENSQLDRG